MNLVDRHNNHSYYHCSTRKVKGTRFVYIINTIHYYKLLTMSYKSLIRSKVINTCPINYEAWLAINVSHFSLYKPKHIFRFDINLSTMQRITSLALLAVAAISSVSAKNVSTIYDCPSLTPRDTATTVSDLRIDDIKAVGFIGDR